MFRYIQSYFALTALYGGGKAFIRETELKSPPRRVALEVAKGATEGPSMVMREVIKYIEENDEKK